MAYSSKAAIAKGLDCKAWIGTMQAVINGKGGGKPDNAQAVGDSIDKVFNYLMVFFMLSSSHTFLMTNYSKYF